MFEYIKKVSLAVRFITEKPDFKGHALKDIFFRQSIDFLNLAQEFRNEALDAVSSRESLRKLKYQLNYLLDIVDYAKITRDISAPNASVFVESLNNFLKYLDLKEQEISNISYTLDLPLQELKNDGEFFARKVAKESSQNRYAQVVVPPVVEEKSHLSTVKAEPAKQAKVVPETYLKRDEAPAVTNKEEIENRRERIMSLLSISGGTIKDVANKLKDVNEKTVQRDLTELISEKKVIMLGKKRWAKYYVK